MKIKNLEFFMGYLTFIEKTLLEKYWKK